jgi:hypothetical protein
MDNFGDMNNALEVSIDDFQLGKTYSIALTSGHTIIGEIMKINNNINIDSSINIKIDGTIVQIPIDQIVTAKLFVGGRRRKNRRRRTIRKKTIRSIRRRTIRRK